MKSSALYDAYYEQENKSGRAKIYNLDSSVTSEKKERYMNADTDE